MIDQINRAIDKRLRGIRLAFRGVVRLVQAAGAVQLIQVEGLAGEQLQGAELMQHYGYTSSPPGGTMCVVIPIGGKTAHGIIVATEHGSYRLAGLASGESAIYDDQGQKVHITRNGIVIDGAGKPVTVQNAPSVDFDVPHVTMSGDLTVTGEVTGNGIHLSSHRHSGIQPGGSNTGGPV